MVVHNAEFIAAHTDGEKTCISCEPVITVKELARAYVPFQFICDICTGEAGLIKGTIFPELHRHYEKRTQSDCRSCYPGAGY